MLKFSTILILGFLIAFAGKGQEKKDTSRVELLLLIVEPIPDAAKSESFMLDTVMQNGVNDLANLLSINSTAFIRSYGPNGVATASFRGSRAEHTKLYFNDIDLAYPSLGMLDLNLVPLRSASSMEVNYGHAGMKDGTGAIGGSINLGNEYYGTDTLAIMYDFNMNSLYNSYQSLKLRSDHKKIKFTVFGDYHIGQNRIIFENPSLQGRPVDTLENSQFNIYSYGADIELNLIKGIKLKTGFWIKHHEKEIPPITSVDSYYGEKLIDDIGLVHFQMIKDWSSVKLKYSAGYTYSTNYYENPLSGIIGNNKASTIQNVVNLYSVNNKYNWAVPFQINLRHQIERARSQNLIEDLSVQRYSIYGAGQYVHRARYKFHIAARAEVFDQQFSGINPNLSVVYRPGYKNRFMIKMNASRNLRFPSLNEKYWSPGGNTELKEEISKQLEFSIYHKTRSQSWFLENSLTSYMGLIDDWIIWQPGNTFWSPHNVKQVKTSGLELNSKLSYKDKHVKCSSGVMVGYGSTVNNNVEEGNENILGKQLILVPKLTVNINSTVSFKSWKLSYNQPLVGRYYLTSSNDSYMPMYSYANVFVSRTIKPNANHKLDVCLGVNNFTNWQYQVVPGRPMPGRYYHVSLNYIFK